MVLFLFGQMLLEFVVLSYVFEEFDFLVRHFNDESQCCEVDSSWDISKMGPAAYIYKN